MHPPSARIPVLIRHEDPVLRAGLAAALAAAADIAVLPHGAAVRPGNEVLVADHRSGLAAVAGSRPGSGARVVVVTATLREWEIRSAIEAGVLGYVQPDCELADLLQAVRRAHRGVRHLDAPAAARLADSLATERLTPREEDVLALVVDGLGNQAIAARLDIALGTVKTHLKSSYGKLRVRSRTEAVVTVERRGLLRESGRSERGPA